MSSIKVLLVDDHPIVREGLVLAIEAQSNMEVAGEASTAEEAIELASHVNPDVVLMDLKMPGMGGMAGIAKIKEASPDSQIVVFTTYASEEEVAAAIESGAAGYLLKGTSSKGIVNAIVAASRGEAPIDPAVAKLLIGRMGKPANVSGLSEREVEVLKLMAEGLRNKEIAARLFITEKTVKAHAGNIFNKLGVPDRTSAVTTALKKGIIRL
ncbi:MAG: response regulator [Candidatus Aquicultorales bacterium]